jgi:hypothetical protein
VTEIYRFIAGKATIYPAAILCRVLGVSRSGYYDWRERRLLKSRGRRCGSTELRVPVPEHLLKFVVERLRSNLQK